MSFSTKRRVSKYKNMEIMASFPLTDEWSLVLLFRRDNPDYPFVITGWNNFKNESYWKLFQDKLNKNLGVVFDKNVPEQILIQNLSQRGILLAKILKT